MQNKLQELTDKLYNEGLSKGKQEAEKLLANARIESEEILEEARLKADKILAQARKEAEDIRKSTERDVAMASEQTISGIKQQVEQAVVARAVGGNVRAALSDPAFVRQLITTVVQAFNPAGAEAVDLELILPEGLKKELGEGFEKDIAGVLNGKITIKGVKGTAEGFSIAPEGEGYRIGFTGNDFTGMFSSFLRENTRRILFGE